MPARVRFTIFNKFKIFTPTVFMPYITYKMMIPIKNIQQMKKIITALVLSGITFVSQAQHTVNVSDFGLTPSSFLDATEPVQRAIAACKGKPNARLIFPQGRYDFWLPKAEQRELFISNTSSAEECPSKIKSVGLLFEDMRGLTVEGNGSLFVFHGKMITFALDRCEDIRLQNFTVDFERPTMSEMQLLEVDKHHIVAAIHPDSKYAVLDGKLRWYGEGWGVDRYFVIMQDTLAGTAVYSSWDPILRGKTTELGLNRVRIDGDFGNAGYKVGQILTLRDPYRDHVGVLINRSKNVQLENLTMRYMHGLGVVAQFSENLRYRQVSIVPSRGRTVAAFADGMHFSGCRGTITIDSCRFKGLHDDPINVHGTYLRITDIRSPTQLTVRFMHGQTYGFPAFYPQDTVAFIHARSLQTRGLAVVKVAKLISEREMQIELTRPLPEGLGTGDCLENLTWTPSLEVRRCRFERTNTRGLLISTPRRVLVENNVFYRTGMYGILIAGDAGSWFESGAVRDVLIRNNLFDGCAYNFSSNSYAISVEPENHETLPGHWVHRNIRIENNTFKTYEAQIIRARSVEKLVFEGNLVEKSPWNESGTGSAPPFKLEGCTDVSLRNNRYEGKTPVVECSKMGKGDIRTDGAEKLMIND
jgi:hypothetical protein